MCEYLKDPLADFIENRHLYVHAIPQYGVLYSLDDRLYKNRVFAMGERIAEFGYSYHGASGGNMPDRYFFYRHLNFLVYFTIFLVNKKNRWPPPPQVSYHFLLVLKLI